MRKHLTLSLVLGLAVVFGTAHADAAKKGDKLYIKAKNTKVMAKPKPTANVVKILQPGEAVVWHGSAKVKRWHKVEYKGKKGVVFQSNLSAKKPKMEMVAAKGGKVDPKAFASSGAATKALGEGAKSYGEKMNMADAVAGLEALEVLTKQITPADIAKHAKKNRLFPVVGAEQ